MMKRVMQVLVVLALLLGVLGVARYHSSWASALPGFKLPAWGTEVLLTSGLSAPVPARITITQNETYNIGGVCLLTVDFKSINMKVEADAEVPIKESQKVPFSFEGELFYPGCHFVVYKQDKVIGPLDSNDGSLKVCFGANPDIELKIYYYLDNPESGDRVWQPLQTTLEDNDRLACAPAAFSGVYMPAGEVDAESSIDLARTTFVFPGTEVGTVRTPPRVVTITQSGTYAAGGICTLKAEYFVTGLSNDLSVTYNNEDTLVVPFPGTDDLLYFPGCQVLHYRDNKIRPTMTREEGQWEICFAARPGKEMTIYYYRDDLEDITPPWVPLETRTSGGLACADLVEFSAIYAPAGK